MFQLHDKKTKSKNKAKQTQSPERNVVTWRRLRIWWGRALKSENLHESSDKGPIPGTSHPWLHLPMLPFWGIKVLTLEPGGAHANPSHSCECWLWNLLSLLDALVWCRWLTSFGSQIAVTLCKAVTTRLSDLTAFPKHIPQLVTINPQLLKAMCPFVSLSSAELRKCHRRCILNAIIALAVNLTCPSQGLLGLRRASPQRCGNAPLKRILWNRRVKARERAGRSWDARTPCPTFPFLRRGAFAVHREHLPFHWHLWLLSKAPECC